VGFIDWWWGILGVWDLRVWQRWWLWVGVVLVVWLLERMLLPMFMLMNDLDGVLELRESCSFSVDVLPSSFDALSCWLSFCDTFWFLMEPLNLLLNSGLLCLLCSFVFEGLILPIFNLK
jgi:hypothetical protein